MSRLRKITENGIYHITQRAPGRELLFLESNDHLYFLSLLKKTAKKFKINIFCFALLPNHLHILIKIKDKNLAEGMKFLFQSYALYFNLKYKRKGHVFCGRYYASICHDDKYLLTASIYIHLNPFKAKLTNNIVNYKWFSLDPYLKPIKSSFINTNEILSLLSNDTIEARKTYEKLLKNSSDLDYQDILKNPKGVNSFFINFIQSMQNSNLLNNQKKQETLAWINLEKQISEIRNQQRFRKPSEKKAVVYTIKQLQLHNYSINEISQLLSIHRTNIYRLLKEYSN